MDRLVHRAMLSALQQLLSIVVVSLNRSSLLQDNMVMAELAIPISPEQILAVHLGCLAQLCPSRAPQFKVATAIRTRLFSVTAAVCHQTCQTVGCTLLRVQSHGLIGLDITALSYC